MKNKTVLFSNMKGGTGKTTLCELFATYAVEKGLPIIVYDADTQLSLYKDRQDDVSENPDAETLWDIYPLIVDDNIKEQISSLKNVPGVVLIDCPGNIDNENLQEIFAAADIVIMPFRYDRKNVRETETFSEILRQCSSARILYAPNMITSMDAKRENLREARNLAYKHFKQDKNNKDFILSEIMDRICLRDCNTIALNSKQRMELRNAFDKIIDFIKI